MPSFRNRCKPREIFGISAPNSGGKVPDSSPKRKGRNNSQQGSRRPQSCQVWPCRATHSPSAASLRWLRVPLCPRAPSGCPSCQGQQRGRGVGAAVQVVEGLQRALGAVANVGELHRGPHEDHDVVDLHLGQSAEKTGKDQGNQSAGGENLRNLGFFGSSCWYFSLWC